MARNNEKAPQGELAVDRTKYLDEQEVQTLMSATEAWSREDLDCYRTRGVIAWAVVDTALRTGLRVSELARLTVGDVDFGRALLRVSRLKRRTPTQESLAIPNELVRHLAWFMAWKIEAGHDMNPEAPLFLSTRAGFSRSGLARLWNDAAARAGLPKGLSIHCARHTLAFHLLRRTGNLRLVQKQLGHANPATTANMYADVAFDDMRAAGNGLYGNGKEADAR